MGSVIKKLHQLQAMATLDDNISVQISTFNVSPFDTFWTLKVAYWHSGNIRHVIDVISHDKNSNYRIDMMLKYRTLEK